MKDFYGKAVTFIVIISILFVVVSAIFNLNLNDNGISVKPGDTIKVDYTGTFDNDTIFDTSIGKEPLEFVAGSGQMIPGFDEAVVGMGIGEEKYIRIDAIEAYGEYNEDLVQSVPKERLSLGEDPEVGMIISVISPNGNPIPATLTEVTKDTVTIDLNHPFAGKPLNFNIKIVEINP
jgi:FKBP-type peptidyl-prolyl cis-trans isomerase 2